MKRVIVGLLVTFLVLGLASLAAGRNFILDFWRDDALARQNRAIDPVSPTTSSFPVFYSPDGQSRVSLTLAGESMTEYIRVHPMLSLRGSPPVRLDMVLEYLPSVSGKNSPVIWIDNSRLLLSGCTIYSTDSGLFRPLEPLAGINWLAAYAIAPDRTKLAIHGNFPHGPQEVGVIDLSTEIYERVFTADRPNDVFHPRYQVGWDSDGNLYFDFPEGTQPVIRRYDGNQVATFLSDATLESLSPQGTLLAWRQLGSVMPKAPQPPPKSAILDLASSKELLAVGAACETVWADDDQLAGLLDRVTGTVHLYRKTSSRTQAVKLPEGAAVTDFIKLTPEGIETHIVSGPEGAKGLSRVVIPF